MKLPIRRHTIDDLVWWITGDESIKGGRIEGIEVFLTGEVHYIIFGMPFTEEDIYSDPRAAWEELQKL